MTAAEDLVRALILLQRVNDSLQRLEFYHKEAFLRAVDNEITLNVLLIEKSTMEKIHVKKEVGIYEAIKD